MKKKEIAFWGMVPSTSPKSIAFRGWVIDLETNGLPWAEDSENVLLSEGGWTNPAYNEPPVVGKVTKVFIYPPSGYKSLNYKIYAGVTGQGHTSGRVALALSENGPFVRASEGLNVYTDIENPQNGFTGQTAIWIKTIMPYEEKISLWLPSEGFIRK